MDSIRFSDKYGPFCPRIFGEQKRFQENPSHFRNPAPNLKH